MSGIVDFLMVDCGLELGVACPQAVLSDLCNPMPIRSTISISHYLKDT